MQSGPPLAFWSMHNDTIDLQSYVRVVGDRMNCNQEDMADLVECLRSAPLDIILVLTYEVNYLTVIVVSDLLAQIFIVSDSLGLYVFLTTQ